MGVSTSYFNVLENIPLSKNKTVMVGKPKGHQDRQIVADTFFAEGSQRILITADVAVFKNLARLSQVPKNQINKFLPDTHPSGFDVTINHRTIRVIPISGK
ncbi:MAG: hypothetical protein P8179_25455 [Candidatus Thiodiazotropha sp.]